MICVCVYIYIYIYIYLFIYLALEGYRVITISLDINAVNYHNIYRKNTTLQYRPKNRYNRLLRNEILVRASRPFCVSIISYKHNSVVTHSLSHKRKALSMKGDERHEAYTYFDSYSEFTFVSNLPATTKLKDRIILNLLPI
jgi:hypothetical protein